MTNRSPSKPPSLVDDPFRDEKFKAKRRQKFLTAKYFDLNEKYLNRRVPLFEKMILDEAGEEKDPAGHSALFHNALSRLRLHYTAGEAIEDLLPLYEELIRRFAEWHIAYGVFLQSRVKNTGKDLNVFDSPLDFEELEDFQDAVEVLSIGVLFGDGARVQEASDWLVRYRNDGDMLIEAIIGSAVTDFRDEVETFFHRTPYDPLLDAIYTAETGEQASAFVKKYLESWYKAFEGSWWHATHQIQHDYMTPYNGYWSFEAAAVCVIYDIDDSTFRDHLVYPKDLADWARKNESLGKLKAAADAARANGMRRMRCEGGQPCPQAGYWFTTAQSNSRRHFEAGSLMPVFPDAKWGATIWYWHEDQTSER